MATRQGFVYGTTSKIRPLNTVAPESAGYDSVVDEGTLDIGTFLYSLTGLDPSTTYYFRAFIYDEQFYSYGDELSFETTGTGGIIQNALFFVGGF
jgi:hypothetical protein